MNSPVEHDIYLRCHTRILGATQPWKRTARKVSQFPKYVLVIDTETTTDSRQDLNFGVYQFCEKQSNGNYLLKEEGLFYADDLNAAQLRVIRNYVRQENRKRRGATGLKLTLYSRAAFVEKVMYTASQARAAIVAFNLPFDLSRLAVEYRVARKAGGRGWSFILFTYKDKKGKLVPNTFRPRVQLRPKDSKAAFIRFAGGDANQPFWEGRFLDLKTLVWALRNRSLSLESACREFKVPGKLSAYTPSGRVTQKEIDYCRQDVRATVGLLNAVLAEFRSYPLGDLHPERAFSAASIAKAFLATMGMTPPQEKFGLDDRTLGFCMQGYYGGRAEIRIRHTPVPVVYTDFTSQYPTVNTLLGLWRLLTAKSLRDRDATHEVRKLLKSITLDWLLHPAVWPKLTFFALIQPEGDILPVRAVYAESRDSSDTNIGLNPLTSDKPLWFAGPDIVASILLTGKVPNIIRAIRFQTFGIQRGMKPVELGKGEIDPRRDDFFRKVIEERKGKDKSDPLYYFLKILANAGCYGIIEKLNPLFGYQPHYRPQGFSMINEAAVSSFVQNYGDIR